MAFRSRHANACCKVEAKRDMTAHCSTHAPRMHWVSMGIAQLDFGPRYGSRLSRMQRACRLPLTSLCAACAAEPAAQSTGTQGVLLPDSGIASPKGGPPALWTP